MPGRLVVLDSVLVDVTVVVDDLPARGSDTLARRSVIAAGGGFNVAAAASRQGLPSVYGGRLGTGPLSDTARDALRAEGVEVALAPDPASDVGVCLVLVDGDGERTFVTAPGSELSLSAADLASLRVGPGDYLYLSGYNLVYPGVGPAVVGWLATLDERVVVAVDPGGRVGDIDASLLAPVVARADWVLASVAEARVIVGPGDARAVAAALAARARGGAVVHDGARGCAVARDGATAAVPGYPVEPVDSNGAGDAHNGVFLAGLAAGLAPEAAADRANGAAAFAVSRVGPATSPREHELAEWFARFTGGE